MSYNKSSSWSPIYIAIFIIGIVWLACVYGNSHMTHMQNWAKENDLDIVSIEACYFDKGPYWYTDSEDSTTYVMKVMDKDGKERISYFNFGFYTDQKWKD